MDRAKLATVVGGANVDVVGFPAGALLDHESNPGRIEISAGGVGRNVAENLARLGVETRLLTVVGDDVHGGEILDDCRRAGVDVADSTQVSGASTPCYLAILDGGGDLRVAVSQMDLVDTIDRSFIDDRAAVIESSQLVVVDANLRREAIVHLVERFTDQDFFFETVSAAKAVKMRDLIGHGHTIKPNRAEAEMLSGIEVRGPGDLNRMLDHFLEAGVQRVFVSLGREGLFYGDAHGSGHLRAPSVAVSNATGSGDAAMAALAYCHLRCESLEYSARFATAAAALTLTQERTVAPEMGVPAVEARIQEVGWT